MELLGGVTPLLEGLLDPIIRGVTLLLMELLGGVTQLLGGVALLLVLLLGVT